MGRDMTYAEWCVEQDDSPTKARGQFIEAQLKIVTYPKYSNELAYHRLRSDERRLRQAYQATWGESVAQMVGRFDFQLGFIEYVSMSASGFVKYAEVLFQRAPILHLDLPKLDVSPKHLFECDYLRRLRSLSM